MSDEMTAAEAEAAFKTEAFEKMTRDRERYAAEKEIDSKRFGSARCWLWHDWYRVGVVADTNLLSWRDSITKSALVLWECAECGKREVR